MWYERLLGGPPSFAATPTEAVWELAAHRSVSIEERPEHAGHAMHTIFVDDLDTLVADIAARGIEPTVRETYDNGVRKATYHDRTATRSASAARRCEHRGGVMRGLRVHA